MCGIVGYIGKENAGVVLLDGLRRLEYRGYDSAGVVSVLETGLDIRRAVGKLSALENLLRQEPVQGGVGIGHTRWATHGHPSEQNAHPHRDCTGRVALVHNGIIENYLTLKAELTKRGHTFVSQTDTEVVAHLIEEAVRRRSPQGGFLKENDFVAAVREALAQTEGAYALGIMCADCPGVVLGVRKDSPLILGVGEGEFMLASDVPAVLPRTRDVIFLEDGDLVVLTEKGYRVTRVEADTAVERKVSRITWDPLQAEKGGYRHFMLKEIFEQPRTVEDTLRGRVSLDDWQVYLENMHLEPALVKALKKVTIVACGTSWHAALVGKYLCEKWMQVPCEVDIASEYRYRDPLIGPGHLLLTISQSGETADTIAAMRHAKGKGAHTLAICNVIGSTLSRETHGKVYTHCGPEIGVASTKAFTAQLSVLYLLSLYGAMIRGSLSRRQVEEYMKGLLKLPHWISDVLKLEPQIKVLAKAFHQCSDFLYLGRNVNFPIALEGALKLKEISYIHAEGYPAGEMKHGPIALIDENMPVLVIATRSAVYEKVLSNMEEVKARGGTAIALATQGDTLAAKRADHVLFMPDMPEAFSPCVNVVPLQLLAYHISLLRGCDVDQPRNLAKSVTVE